MILLAISNFLLLMYRWIYLFKSQNDFLKIIYQMLWIYMEDFPVTYYKQKVIKY